LASKSDSATVSANLVREAIHQRITRAAQVRAIFSPPSRSSLGRARVPPRRVRLDWQSFMVDLSPISRIVKGGPYSWPLTGAENRVATGGLTIPGRGGHTQPGAPVVNGCIRDLAKDEDASASCEKDARPVSSPDGHLFVAATCGRRRSAIEASPKGYALSPSQVDPEQTLCTKQYFVCNKARHCSFTSFGLLGCWNGMPDSLLVASVAVVLLRAAFLDGRSALYLLPCLQDLE
jgi:hypothetical protein